ncbi:AI-2E family transporter [Candidatus Woesearchaeota archaeon]|nr:AI-2E family transporter [Candidatus Woesearchaeota archaeon]
MAMFDPKTYSKYVMMIFFFVVLITSYLIVKPVLTAALTAVVLAYLFYPLFKFINKYLKKNWISAVIVFCIIFLVITLSFFWILNTLLKEVFVIYTIGEQRLVSGNILGIDCTINPTLCNKVNFLKDNLRLQYYIKEYLVKFRELLTNSIDHFVFSIPKRLVEFVVALFIAFFLIRDGEHIFNRSRAIFTLKEHHEKSLVKQFNDTIFAVVYGHLIISLSAGFFGALGFWIFDIPSPIFWGIIIALLALLPLIGGSVIWIVACITLFLNGHVTSGILLFIYSLIFISGLEFFMKPKIIGEKANIHPIFIIVGVIGGLAIFGFIGFIVGPVILALLVTFFEIIEQEKITIEVK